jgi:ABC-type nitrate/sulfonate/bicarbonate transport system substrate-binding protein
MKILCLPLIAVVLLLVSGCGGQDSTEGKEQNAPQSKEAAPDPLLFEKQGTKGLRLLEITIDGYPNADYGGLYLGDRLGYFADVGLQLHVHTPIEPRRPVLYVAGKVVELGVSHQPEVALAQARGTPIVAVGSWLPRATTSLIWLPKSGIHGIADLKGKTIATEGLEYQERFLEAILSRANLSLDDVKVIRPKYLMIPALKGGRADAAIGGSWNVEGVQLRSEGFDPVVMPVTKLGIPNYEELVLIAREDSLDKGGETIRKFLSALARGTRAAQADPAAAARAIEAASESHGERAAKGTAVTLPMLSRSNRMDAARWRSFSAWMETTGLLESAPFPSQLLTNAYVP